MLFNIYISDIPDTVSTQYDYADDLALLFSQGPPVFPLGHPRYTQMHLWH